MEISQSIEKSTVNLKFMSASEEEIKQTIQIKEEFDIINDCEFHSVITIENNPMESILYKKPKLGKRKYTCYNCGNSFFSKSRLKCHMIIHTGSNVDNENCPLQFMSTSEEEIKQPNTQTIEIKKETDLISRIHPEENSPICDARKKSFRGKSTLKCDVCEVSFTKSSSLKEHISIHTGERPFKCKICKKSFRQRSTLLVHTRSHTGEKPFKCDVCEISFAHRASLRRHKFIHTEEKPFVCDICKLSFNAHTNLKRHKLIHTGEKLFKCDICKFACIQLSSLKEHILIHTGEKPFKCKVCKKSFRQSSTLLVHTKRHTGEKPYRNKA